MSSVESRVLQELHRAAVLAGRPGVVVISEDRPRADRASGSASKTMQAIERLVGDGKAIKVRRGLLVLPDQTGRVSATLPDLIDVVAPEPYVITGGRALEEHELTDQHFFVVVALVPSPVASFAYRGEKAEFLITPAARIWPTASPRPTPPRGGRVDAAPRTRRQPRFAEPERAVLDAANHPRYGVSIGQATSALRIALARDPRFLRRLLAAARRYHSAAAARRVGLLVERIAGPEQADPFHDLIGKSRTPVALRPGGAIDGPVDRKWRVAVNADLDLVLETA